MASKLKTLKTKTQKLPKLMDKSVRIYVGKCDIEQSIKMREELKVFSHFSSCPISLALKRRYSNIDVVGLVEVKTRTKGYYDICIKGRKFICNFDNKIPVKPFHLYLTKRWY